MSFVSPEFALIALIFFPAYWSLSRHRSIQLGFLTVSGYALYATWSVQFAAILLVFSAYIWLAGNWVQSCKTNPGRKLWFAISVLISLVLLLTSKYYEFVRQMLAALMPSVGMQALLPVIDIVAPAGISFFTFQAVTYLVWQYESKPPRASFIHLLLFLSFWPTLFAGPIMRARDFFAQLGGSDIGLPRQTQKAIYYILLGLFQKMVFASWLASTFVDEAFKYPDAQTFVTSLAAIVGYSLQIFLDFAGYTLIVTGLALLLGFSLPINFKQPYLALNLQEFWRHWHISLSSFIRDYIYIPLGGNRKGFFHTQFNILLAMVISGLWHGANSTFITWGALHGLGVVFVNLYDKALGKKNQVMPVVIARLFTLSYIALAWVFFRADNNEAALQLLTGLVNGLGNTTFQHGLLAAFAVIFFLLSQRAQRIEQVCVQRLATLNWISITVLVTALAFIAILLGPSGVPSFIYYRF
jgi:D-alanyl-lipoteichoic acid acyltransferase DltB (MBOAT superfamily)